MKDLKNNVPFYFNLGIKTYLVVDAITPKSKWREQIQLHLWHKETGYSYQKMSADNEGYLLLPEIKIKIRAQQQRLIFVDAVTNKVLRDRKQFDYALTEAEQKAEAEAQRANTAEQRAEQLAQLLREKGIVFDELG